MKNTIYFLLGCALAATPVFAQTGNVAIGMGALASIAAGGNDNTAVGDSAGTNNTTGDQHVLFGNRAGFHLIDAGAADQIFIGYEAGFFAEFMNAGGNPFDNVFIGSQAGRSVSGTNEHVFIGRRAGWRYTDGTRDDNVIIGEEAGFQLTTGGDNVFIGENAGYGFSTGYDNTFVGSNAGGGFNTGSSFLGTGSKNTAFGNEALSDLDETGHRNTAIGDSAGNDVGEGFSNTFLGAASGAATEHADYNTFVGALAGWDNNRNNGTNNANRNTYIGRRTGYTNRQGEDNAGIGAFADFNNTLRGRASFAGAFADLDAAEVVVVGYDARAASEGNVSIGAESDATGSSGVAVGYLAQSNALDQVVIGREASSPSGSHRTVVIGTQASASLTNSVVLGDQAASTVNNSLAIGNMANASGENATAVGANASASGVNSMALGYQATVATDNTIRIGNGSVTAIGGVVNWTATSDARFKENVREDVPGLIFVEELNPLTYAYDVQAMNAFNGLPAAQQSNSEKEKIRYSGFVAQDVAAAAQKVHYDFSGVDAPGDLEKAALGLRYEEFTAPLIKAMQELHTEIKANDEIIARQEKMLTNYAAFFEQAETQLAALEREKAQQAKQSKKTLKNTRRSQ